MCLYANELLLYLFSVKLFPNVISNLYVCKSNKRITNKLYKFARACTVYHFVMKYPCSYPHVTKKQHLALYLMHLSNNCSWVAYISLNLWCTSLILV